MAFSPDARYLVTASNDRRLALRDSRHGEVIVPAWHSSTNLKTVACHPHAALLAAGGTEGVGEGFERPSRCYFFKFLQTDPPHLEMFQEKATETAVMSVAFSPDGEHLLMSTRNRLSLFRVHLI